jgi:prevent-host-death family protein
MEIGVKEARSQFSSLLDEVEKGHEVTIRRRGKKIARLVPAGGRRKILPSLKGFRSSIGVKGEPVSTMVYRNRKEERY